MMVFGMEKDMIKIRKMFSLLKKEMDLLKNLMMMEF